MRNGSGNYKRDVIVEHAATGASLPLVGPAPATPILNRNRSKVGGRRAGTTLVEVIVAAMLLGTVMAIAIPSLGLVGYQRRAAERRQQAMLEVENLMERFTATGWDGATAERAAQLKLSADVERQLPGAVLQCEVTPQSAPLETKRIQIELTWSNRAGEAVAPVRLTTWVYRPGRPQ